MTSAAITVTAPSDIPEVTESTDLTDLIAGHLDLRDGDIVVVTSKVVSKAEGRVVTGDRDALIAAETVEVIARRDKTLITRSASGLVQAAAGVDGSNVPAGTVVLLPQDPDESARRLRTGLAARANVAVIVTDTAGRAWRVGQTDIAIGAAGIQVLDSYAGRTDAFGNTLAVTAPAVADELAGAAELVKTKLSRRPVALVRGLGERVLPPGQHGPGAIALVRPRSDDMFALGAREAVLAAVRGDNLDSFGAPVSAEELIAQLTALGATVIASGADVEVVNGAETHRIAAHALGWRSATVTDGRLRLTAR